MRNYTKQHLSPALPGTSLTPEPPQWTKPAWCPWSIVSLPVSSLYSPSGHSTHSKQQVGSPSMIPFLVPAKQSRLQLEKGTWSTESTKGTGCSCAISLTAPLPYVRQGSWAQGLLQQTPGPFQTEEGPEALSLWKGEMPVDKWKYTHTHLWFYKD